MWSKRQSVGGELAENTYITSSKGTTFQPHSELGGEVWSGDMWGGGWRGWGGVVVRGTLRHKCRYPFLCI